MSRNGFFWGKHHPVPAVKECQYNSEEQTILKKYTRKNIGKKQLMKTEIYL